MITDPVTDVLTPITDPVTDVLPRSPTRSRTS